MGSIATPPPAVSVQKPLLTRISYGIQAVLFQKLIGTTVLVKSIQDKIWTSPFKPTLSKSYPCRPSLHVNAFFPKTYDRSKPSASLPVFFSVHGGGFVIGNPDNGNEWNTHFSDTNHALVIALDYAKAPSNPFPGPVHDVAALLLAALDDPDLAPHMDRARVAIGGFSAGGNLALTASQLPAVRPHISAVVPLYPAVDFATPFEPKTKLRRYKPELGGFRAGARDYLLALCDVFDWSYVPVGQDLRDPLLSPFYAPREALPPRVFVLACEMDMLSHEGWRMASKLAGRPIPGMDRVVGRQETQNKGELVLDDELYHWRAKVKGDDGVERDYRWLLVPDAVHAFDQDAKDMASGDKAMLADAAEKTNKTIQIIGDWLWK